eukprot:1408170-Rhodomonas_salina.2
MLGVRWVDERDANVERGLARTQVVSSRSEMMCAGILNVHAVRDAITPVQLICDSVPKETVEELYGIAVKAKKVVKEVSRDPLGIVSTLLCVRSRFVSSSAKMNRLSLV